MNLLFKGYNWNSDRGLSLGLLFPVGSTCVCVTDSTNDDMGIKFLNNNFYFFSLIAAYPRPAQLGFQEPVTPVMEGIIDFHHDLMFFLAFILGFVCWFLVNIGYSFFSRLPEDSSNPYFVPFVRVPSRKNHHLWLEIIWTIIPALILVSIVLPSFALIYSMDEFFLHPRVTLKAVGNQWYWTYNYGCALEYNPKNALPSDGRINDLVNFLMSIRDSEAYDFFSENWANSYEGNENADVIDALKESAVETMVYYYLSLDKDDIDNRILNGDFDIKFELEYLLERAFCNYEYFADLVVLNRLSPDLEVTVENIKKDLVERAVVEVIFPVVASIEEKISRGETSVESDLKQVVYDALSLYSDFSEVVKLKRETLGQDSIVRHHFALKFDSYMKAEDQLAAGQIRLLEVDKRVLLPTLTGIRLLVSSYDVLHSWAVPSFGVKLDGCPGRLNQTFLYVKDEGLFYGQCSEICGVNHAFMPIAIRTISPNQFNFWLAQRIEVFSNLIKESSLEKTETNQIKYVTEPVVPTAPNIPPIPDISPATSPDCVKIEAAFKNMFFDHIIRTAILDPRGDITRLVACISEDHKTVNMECVRQVIEASSNLNLLCEILDNHQCPSTLVPFRGGIASIINEILLARGESCRTCFKLANSEQLLMAERMLRQLLASTKLNQTTISMESFIEYISKNLKK